MNTNKTKPNISGNRVFVGLSGGVDSAVSAALLREQGYDVTGVFIKVWAPDFLACTWREERRDAMRVAAHLNIPFLFMDFETEYKKGVADYMIDEYRKGRTPNPDVMCNREVKFGAFWQKAKEMGADYIATGHYAQNIEGSLKEGCDPEKDQSYFLWTLTQEDLAHTLFPVGHLEKKEVRKLAEKFDLPVAAKKDSQGICFLGDVTLEDFLPHFMEIGPGNVVNAQGEIIGTHKGAVYYTLGERHGFEITKKTPDSKPHFVISKDMEKNTITVSDNPITIQESASSEIKVEKVNWITPVLHRVSDAVARVRYRQEKFPVTVAGSTVHFDQPRLAAPGQSIVFYKDDICLGGGVIS